MKSMITPTTKLNLCKACGSADFNRQGQIVTVADSTMLVANIIRCRDCDVVSFWHEKLRLMISSNVKR
jgi:hypothetical protein